MLSRLMFCLACGSFGFYAAAQAAPGHHAPEGFRNTYPLPLGLKAWFGERGIDRVVELDWWQSHALSPLTFTLVPVQHWSKRTLWDTNRSLWGG